MKKRMVVGITGGLGTGKTTVSRMFGRLGAYLIDADKIAHKVILPGNEVYKKVISLFGAGILKKNGRIDRKKLGKIVFNDKKKLVLLNSVIHPEVIKRVKEIVKKPRRPRRVFIIDAPLLIEAGALDMTDRLIVVTADRKTQIKRCMKGLRLSRADIKRMIRNQMPLSKKRRLADFIIDNNGSFSSTRKEVEKIWREIEKWHRKR